MTLGSRSVSMAVKSALEWLPAADWWEHSALRRRGSPISQTRGVDPGCAVGRSLPVFAPKSEFNSDVNQVTSSLIPLQTMAKSKGKGQKQPSVFHVANSKNVKAKHKAKPVKTSLKKISVATKDKVNRVDDAFTELHKEVAQQKKGNQPKLGKHKQPSRQTEAPADVDSAADLFSQL